MTRNHPSTMGESNHASSRQYEAISRKPVTPAAGSQADHSMESELHVIRHDNSKPTNRDRYENKPMPEIPSETDEPVVSPSRKPYIQPAIPLVNPTTPQTKRAVTDPVGPRSYPIARKPSVSHLRKVFGHAKRPSRDDKQGLPTLPQTTRKAAIILGLPQQDEAESSTATINATTSDEASTEHSSSNANKFYEVSDESRPQHERSDSQSTIGASSSRLLEAPVISVSTEDNHTTDIECATYTSRPDIQSSLSPKIASYGQVGDKAFVHDQKLFRVESVQGIIEHAESTQHTGSEFSNPKVDITVPERQSQTPKLPNPSGGSDNYQGIWENDPAVGYSLPPFSPDPKANQGMPQYAGYPTQHPELSPSVYHEDATRRSLQLDNRSSTLSQPFSASTPTFHQGHPNISTFMHAHNDLFYNRHLPSPNEIRPQLGSANSWARTSVANEPLSALLPPRWPNHSTNSVPPPPLNQQEYQHSDTLVAGISQLDRTIHHHLDQAFNGLSRLIIDKHDRVLDQVLRNLDDIGDVLAKNHKAIKSDLKGINSGIHKLQTASNEASVGNHTTQEHLKVLENATNKVGKSLDDQLRHFRNLTDLSDERQSRSLTNRRAESAHDYLVTGRNDQTKTQEEYERSGSKARHSRTSGRSHRSNTSNGGMIENKAARSGPGLYSLRGPPDIREHPAYAGIPHPPQNMVDQDGHPLLGTATFQSQSLGDHGWYQQAYGSI